MEQLNTFLNSFDLQGLILLVFSTAASLLCITAHELCHGLAAYRLGDTTAKQAGRLSLNPLVHIDPVGFIMMLVAHVGWAKPVPVDIRRFRNPKRDMALTALAGPASNAVLAGIFVGTGSLVLHFAPAGTVTAYVLLFFCYAAVLSVGLGLFNLIPIPPLDGSRILSAVLPDRMYYGLMRYERILMLFVVALVWLGLIDGPLNIAIGLVLRGLCAVTGFEFGLFEYYFGF